MSDDSRDAPVQRLTPELAKRELARLAAEITDRVPGAPSFTVDLLASRLLHALAVGDDTLLRNCLVDEVHVPFRRSLVPGVDQALARIETDELAGVTISGAGPALVMLTTDEATAAKGAAIMEGAFAEEGMDVEILRIVGCPSGALPDLIEV